MEHIRLNLRKIALSGGGGYIFPQQFMDVGIDQNSSIVLTGLLIMSYNMDKLKESRGLELYLEEVVMFSYWEDDCDYLDGWCDPEFKGLRVVLDGSFFPPLQVKEFVGGYIESLSYGYLTPGTFPKILNYLIEFGYPRALIDRIANEMGR